MLTKSPRLMKRSLADAEKAEYVSPKELAMRWQCSRSQVDRIARREGMTRMLLGAGRNGMVRYVRAEVVAFEDRVRV